MAGEMVERLVIGKGKPVDQQTRYKIKFRHRDLRDVVDVTGKSVIDLLNDPFGGWPYLLQFGMRFFNPKTTKDFASDLIDQWLEDSPENEFSHIGDLLMRAIENSGFIKFPKPKESPEDEEGNAQSQTTSA